MVDGAVGRQTLRVGYVLDFLVDVGVAGLSDQGREGGILLGIQQAGGLGPAGDWNPNVCSSMAGAARRASSAVLSMAASAAMRGSSRFSRVAWARWEAELRAVVHLGLRRSSTGCWATSALDTECNG